LRSISISTRGYVTAVFRDTRNSLECVARDRAALIAIVLILLPWFALVFLRTTTDWLNQLAGLAAVVFAFWWMSRSGAAPAPEVTHPRLELLFALALTVFWILWRIGICSKAFFFLPANFTCYQSLAFETVPKIVSLVIFPIVVLFGAGYYLRAQGIDLNWKSWWISLPAVMFFAGYGIYLHSHDIFKYVQSVTEFFGAAGLPEEVLFRAILLTRLERVLRNSGWALFVSSLVFGLTHLPIDYLFFTPYDWRETLITVFTFQMGFGAAFAFAYQRTRNVWPVAVLHALVDAL
jgi:membrane protease YdiL (CAAX protease family)